MAVADAAVDAAVHEAVVLVAEAVVAVVVVAAAEVDSVEDEVVLDNLSFFPLLHSFPRNRKQRTTRACNYVYVYIRVFFLFYNNMKR